jgi:SAM-dependent methyltransferase
MRHLTDDFDFRFRSGDTPWEDPQPWQGLDQLFARFAPPGARVLDVGCGFGTNALRLAALGYRVLGIDVSPTAIEQALVRRAAASVDCEFRCADFLAGEFGVFDVVFDRGCLHGFADSAGRASFAATVAAALPPGALWIDVSGSVDNGDSPDVVRELALPRLSLSDLAAASEALFEAVEITQAVYGATSDTDFRAWSGVFRRRSAGSEGEGGPQANRAVAVANKRFEQTDHGHDSKLGSKRGGAVVCSSTAGRWVDRGSL